MTFNVEIYGKRGVIFRRWIDAIGFDFGLTVS